MEDVFSARMKAVFDFLISPDSAPLAAVVIPRTSEQEHKLYLYLREVVRQGRERAPEVILYNLLHARSPEAEAYGLDRTEALKVALEQLSGSPIEPLALSSAIAEGNRRTAGDSRIAAAEGRSGSKAIRERSAGSHRRLVFYGSRKVRVARAGSNPGNQDAAAA